MRSTSNIIYEKDKTWFYQLFSSDKIFEKKAEKFSYIEYFLSQKFKGDLLYIFDENLEKVWEYGA